MPVITPTRQIIIVTATPSSGPNLSPAKSLSVMSDDEISQGIQQAINHHVQAYNENNPQILEEMVDQQNKPFQRCNRPVPMLDRMDRCRIYDHADRLVDWMSEGLAEFIAAAQGMFKAPAAISSTTKTSQSWKKAVRWQNMI